jgi:hypothetical protein
MFSPAHANGVKTFQILVALPPGGCMQPHFFCKEGLFFGDA